MKAKTERNVFYVFPLFLLISACIWASSRSVTNVTLTPLPTATSTIDTRVRSDLTASATVAAGSFADFRFFATEIAAVLQGRNISFFDKYLASSVWNCLGDETQGVCKDIPAGTTLEGIPVTYDWADYELYSVENYKAVWQTTFASHSVLKLAAIANQLGDNPLMPMAGQSFLAIIAVVDDGDPSVHEVRVLFFEYYEHTWHLAGELIAVEQIELWLNDTCSTCYDIWEAWPK